MYLIYLEDLNDVYVKEVDDRNAEDLYNIRGSMDQKKGSFMDGVLNVSTWEAETEDVAMGFAKYIARQRPGLNVKVSKVSAIVSTTVPETIVKRVSDKGVMPE